MAEVLTVSTDCRSGTPAHTSIFSGNDLKCEVNRLLDNCLSLNTQKTYNTGLAAFHKFLIEYNILDIWPPCLDTVVQFVAFLSLSKKSAKTAQCYLSAISYKCKILGCSDETTGFIVAKVIQGMRRTSGKRDTRLPITPYILQRIVFTLPYICLNSFELKLFKATYTLAFWGLFRIGELTVSSSKGRLATHTLLNTDVYFKSDTEELVINLRSSKTDQFNKGSTIVIPKASDISCAVISMREYLQIRPRVDGPLFCHFNGEPLTRYQFSAILIKTLNLAGVGGGNYKAHSFRIGAATALSMAGYSDDKVKEVGRWKSTAFKSYVRPHSVFVPNNFNK